MRALVRRMGVIGTTSLITLVSTVASVIITWCYQVFYEVPPETLSWGVSILSPLLIAPLVSYHIVCLVFRLDEAESRAAELVRTDYLTGCMNRRYFLELAERELTQAVRHGRPLCLMMVDLDNFKWINDSRGHLRGDRILQHVSGRIRQQLRTSDLVGRFGGEEFLVLLPDTGEPLAGQVAERIRAGVESLDHSAQESFNVTVTLGYTSAVPTDTDIIGLIADADTAMLMAKQAGKNRCLSFAEAQRLLETRYSHWNTDRTSVQTE